MRFQTRSSILYRNNKTRHLIKMQAQIYHIKNTNPEILTLSKSVFSKRTCLLAQTSLFMKIDCSALCAPATAASIRNPGYCPTYSYRLVRPISMILCVQAHSGSWLLSGTFIVNHCAGGCSAACCCAACSAACCAARSSACRLASDFPSESIGYPSISTSLAIVPSGFR